MNNNNQDEKERQPDKRRSGVGSGTGQPVIPPRESEPKEQPVEAPVQEIPIGLPVSDEEFRRLKAEAEQTLHEEDPAPKEDAASE
jgi:hypothetical protein